MDKQKQIEAMARLDGWKACPRCDDEDCIYNSKPDYHTDNEIDRMVRGLMYKELFHYTKRLCGIIKRDNASSWDGDDQLLIMANQATPAQKVEAFLRAKGFWEEGE